MKEVTRMPPVFFGANLHNTHKQSELRRAYCLIQGDLTLSHIDIPLYPHNYRRARALFYRWMHVDGFLIATRYQKKQRVLRLWRCVRIENQGRLRTIRLGAKDRLGLKHIRAGDMISYGPFFSTPRQYRKDWQQYFKKRIREYRNPYVHLLERHTAHPFDSFDVGVTYIIWREL